MSVDGFFVLTGFLLAWKELAGRRFASEGSVSGTLDSLYSRFVRIVPPYWITLALFVWVAFPGGLFPRNHVRQSGTHIPYEIFYKDNAMVPIDKPATIWHTVFLNHLLPFGGPLIWTWSLSIQYLFYLVFPFLWSRLRLHKPARLVSFVTIQWVATLALRVFAQRQQSSFPADNPVNGLLTFVWYSSPLLRFAAFWTGAAAALIATNCPGMWVQWMNGPERSSQLRRWLPRMAIGGLLAAVYAGNSVWPETVGLPDRSRCVRKGQTCAYH